MNMAYVHILAWRYFYVALLLCLGFETLWEQGKPCDRPGSLTIQIVYRRSLRVVMLLRKKLRKLRQGNSSEGSVDDRSQLQRQVRGEVLNILSSLADLSNAVHWMPPGFLWAGCFPNWLVGLMGTTSSLIGLIQMGASQAISA